MEKNFQSGDWMCFCGEWFTLYFNGGELDVWTCSDCGRKWFQQARGCDLYVKEPDEAKGPSEEGP